MAHVDLCSGIGGFALGFEWAGLSKPVLFCDIEPWSRKVLRKHWPDVPIAKDVKELANDPDRLIPDCDILTAGYPCQPFSVAGQRRGSEDDRHIWPEIFSIVQAKRPAWCVFENVSGHITMGLDEVLSDLEGQGYAARPFVVPACATDAPHRRDRVWIIARNVGNPKSERCEQWSDVKREGAENKQEQRLGVRGKPSGSGQDVANASIRRYGDAEKEISAGRDAVVSSSATVADTESVGLQGRQNSRDISQSGAQRKKQPSGRNLFTDGQNSLRQPSVGRVAYGLSYWMDEPRDISRVSTGVPNRVQRLRGLGNAIVPQIAQRIGETIKACQ